MPFDIIGSVYQVETIAIGQAIHELDRLQRVYGPGRWRKLKGIAMVDTGPGAPFLVELHWYEAHGFGRK